MTEQKRCPIKFQRRFFVIPLTLNIIIIGTRSKQLTISSAPLLFHLLKEKSVFCERKNEKKNIFLFTSRSDSSNNKEGGTSNNQIII